MSSSASTSWNEVDVEGGSVDQNSNSEALLTSSIDDTFTEKQVSVFNSHLHILIFSSPSLVAPAEVWRAGVGDLHRQAVWQQQQGAQGGGARGVQG